MRAVHRLTLTGDLPSPSFARAWVSGHSVHVPREVLDDALLMVSELVTNAVRHGRPVVVLTLELRLDRIRIGVYDTGDRLPVMPAGRPSIDRPTGRGLLIVAATASDWGVTCTDDRTGKTVWAEVPLRTVSALSCPSPS